MAAKIHKFLSNNRDELAHRCRIKVRQRPGRSATENQLQNGIPLFLGQLIRTLKIEQTSKPLDSRRVSDPGRGGAAFSEVTISASQHGKDLLDLGLTVDQVVHDYSDLCQSITDLAVERDAPFQVDDFRTLNRCLDNAISDAVTEFSYQRDVVQRRESNERMGFFAHELRNLLGTVSMAFSAAKAGHLSLDGSTGLILERSIRGLEKLIASSLEDVRTIAKNSTVLDSFSLSDFIDEIYAAAELSLNIHGCTFRVPQVDPDLAITGTRDLLMAAVANLLQNAFKFTHPHTEVFLTAYAAGDRILIEVKDHCGGLSIGLAESIFLPFSQAGKNRTGIGLGLSIAKQSVIASGGTLTVQNLPLVGCVFTISLPRHAMPT